MCDRPQMVSKSASSREQTDIAKTINTFNQISQSAVYKEDDKSVTLSVCGGSYGGVRMLDSNAKKTVYTLKVRGGL